MQVLGEHRPTVDRVYVVLEFILRHVHARQVRVQVEAVCRQVHISMHVVQNVDSCSNIATGTVGLTQSLQHGRLDQLQLRSTGEAAIEIPVTTLVDS
jgi:hypothetical protein